MSLAKIVCALGILLLANPSMAQDTDQPKPYTPKNTVYLELGGIGYKYSFNYQRNFSICKHFDVAAGVSANPFLLRRDDYDTRSKITPTGALTLQGIYKFKKNEVALGGAFGYYTYYNYRYINNEIAWKMEGATMSFASLGYTHTWGKHIYTGAYFWLLIASHGSTDMDPWGGLRVGYRFGK